MLPCIVLSLSGALSDDLCIRMFIFLHSLDPDLWIRTLFFFPSGHICYSSSTSICPLSLSKLGFVL